MDLQEIHNKLRKEKKEDLVYNFGRVLNLLAHYDQNPRTQYEHGWSKSREAIIEICNLKRYL